jgi:rRNA processing protein Gar1
MGSEMGSFLHACEGELVCESINTKIPYFNAPIYLQNKVWRPKPEAYSIPGILTRLQTAIGKVDEILGPINQVYFTIKPYVIPLKTMFFDKENTNFEKFKYRRYSSNLI